MKIVFNERAWEEYIYWANENKNMVKKINELIKDIIKNPYSGIGKPEKLKYDKKICIREELIWSIDWFII